MQHDAGAAEASGFQSSPRLIRNGSRWLVDPGELAYAPLFYTGDASAVSAISSDPAALAAMINAPIDMVAFYQWLAFGFLIGDRTIFRGVHRARTGEVIEGDEAGARVRERQATAPPPPTSDPIAESIRHAVADAFRAGAAAELTGGVDSRLALACGLASGSPPRLAFTIGEPNDPDVEVARRIAETFSIPHVVVPAMRTWARVASDAHRFVSGSAYMSNAVEYAWLPSVFERLEPMRDAQLTGAGGEAAYGFYDSPFDAALQSPWLWSVWIRARLCTRLRPEVSLLRRSAGLRREAFADVRRALTGLKGPVQDRTASFYTRERLRTWAAPVLWSSSQWYRVYAPFMGEGYIRWGAGLGAEARSGRRAQRKLIEQLEPGLGAIPFASELTRESSSGRRKLWAKVRRRLLNGEKGSALHRAVATSLASDPEIVRCIVEFGQRHPDIAHNSLNTVLRHPAEHPRAFGFLLSAAFAELARERWRSELHRLVTVGEAGL